MLAQYANEEHEGSVMEKRMLRWILGNTLLDYVYNDEVRARMKVAPIVKKMQEKRLPRYRHVSRRDENHITRMAMSLEVAGKRPRERAKMRWMDRIRAGYKIMP
ncbi:unnamed protein product [Strongylus vulgaris]|uniref:Uncharacterized protein n=1 Tax=Strongylus vulgaris TaxID=40348 RepID=A0A3P7J759_STRVU|nr:unnamed protein product [Strongylus vulgaris]